MAVSNGANGVQQKNGVTPPNGVNGTNGNAPPKPKLAELDVCSVPIDFHRNPISIYIVF